MATMKIIPQDIITTHILRLLPAKSIGRFRCVSKEWLSILTEPRFIQTLQKTLDSNLHFIFDSHEVLSTQTKLDLEFYRINYILGSVNGLVFASAYRKLHDKDYVLLVLNPTTKHYVELPSLNYYNGVKGFGYDSISDDYKVVHISHEHVDVYSLRTDTWKLVGHYLPYDYCKSSLGVFVNGFLHWICRSYSEPLVIVAFSLADEKLCELPSPNSYNEVHIMPDPNTKLVALGDKLAIFNKLKGDILLMNEYGVHESWTKIVVHGFNEIQMVGPKVFFDNGKILFLTGELLSVYDVEKRTFCKRIDISCMNLRKVMGAYGESLFSPKLRKSS